MYMYMYIYILSNDVHVICLSFKNKEYWRLHHSFMYVLRTFTPPIKILRICDMDMATIENVSIIRNLFFKFAWQNNQNSNKNIFQFK